MYALAFVFTSFLMCNAGVWPLFFTCQWDLFPASFYLNMVLSMVETTGLGLLLLLSSGFMSLHVKMLLILISFSIQCGVINMVKLDIISSDFIFGLSPKIFKFSSFMHIIKFYSLKQGLKRILLKYKSSE